MIATALPLRRSARIVLMTAVVMLAAAAPLPVQGQEAPLRLTDDHRAGELVVPVNKSQVLRVDRPFKDLLVGNPDIADVMPMTDRSVYVLGKQVGSTNLTIYGPGRRLIAVIDLIIGHDVSGLRNRLHELMPDEAIEVRAANGAVVLSGSVSTAARLDRVLAVAERYAPEKVTNLLTVAGSQQVMLAVRVAEVKRSLTRKLGLKPTIFGGDFLVDVLDPLDLTAFLGATASFVTGDVNIDVLIDALERKGAVKILAEPNLIALSGDTANFLAGGEFPIPVAQETDDNGTTITVEFKQFGVSLAFTPTVLSNDLINLRVAPEVSQIDETNAVRVSGFEIPGLTTRRANTTVELRDGQSFAIAGLIQSDFTDQVRQIPGIGDIPVLGALFRSSEFQRDETELVIIATPHLVQPAPPGALASPADVFNPPSDTDLFLFGRMEGAPGVSEAEVLSARPGGGISGGYGHILK